MTLSSTAPGNSTSNDSEVNIQDELIQERKSWEKSTETFIQEESNSKPRTSQDNVSSMEELDLW